MLTKDFIQTELQKKREVALISLDLRKAFDTVRTDGTLQNKIRYYLQNDKLWASSQIVSEGYIYTAITWINEDTVSVIWMNRVQNQSEVTECRKDVEKVYFNIRVIVRCSLLL